MPYETVPRPLRQTWGPDPVVLRRLPIKLADGRVVQTGIVESSRENKGFEGDEDFDGDDIPPGHPVEPKVEDVSTGARFGRPAVVDTIGRGSRKESIQASKEQIASICQEIVGDPENSVRMSKYPTTDIRSLSLS
jgi:nucleolar complex protein 3